MKIRTIKMLRCSAVAAIFNPHIKKIIYIYIYILNIYLNHSYVIYSMFILSLNVGYKQHMEYFQE